MTAFRIVVVGAGPAGTRCAMRLRDRLPDAAITLCGGEPALPYDRVALSKLLTGEADAAQLITHPLALLREARIEFRAGLRATAIDRAARQVVTPREGLGYDRLVLATGSRAVRLPVEGAGMDGVVLYRSMADVQQMRRAAREGGQAVVIGGGLLGLEAADGLARAGMRVTVVHAVDWPMERQLDEEAGALLARRLAARGIRFAMPASTVAIEGHDRATGVRLQDGRLLPARLVVMAVGIRPDITLAQESGLPTGRGVVVDATMQTADPAIYAIGECTELNGHTIGLVAPALEQAEVAAAAIAGNASGSHGASWAPRADAAALKISGTAVWSAGEISAADAQSIVLRDEAGGSYRRLLLRQDRLVGAVLYGETEDAGFYLGLIKTGRDIAPHRAVLALGPQHLRDAA